MKWMGINEIRREFLEFFEKKEHLIMDSFPLVPVDDDSLLLINSGMAPLKKFFTGEVTPPRKRIATSQKCIRTPDIENAGKTARHGTFFEMLGNFSFGDYFKKEAIAWAWEFCIDEMGLPAEDFYITVYEEDDEAFDIWKNEIGIREERIIRNDKSENFWEHGAGPCGPCSELHLDMGEKYGCDSPTCGPGCDCDRYLEIWNLVFTQFESDGKGNYTPLANPNIDTGMGLERLGYVLQGVESLFEVDTVRPLMGFVEEKTGVKYGKNTGDDVSLRVIADHIRSTVFLVSDGVLPSNEGRGYVLRRLLRRASRHARMLGLKEAFLVDLTELMISLNEDIYPELRTNESYIKKVISSEEARFEQTIDQGINLLTELIETLAEEKNKILSGEDAFKLYDTFGFPIDLTREILEEHDLGFDEKSFISQMEEQRNRARKARESLGDVSWVGKIALEGVPQTAFVGYDLLELDTKVEAIIENVQRVNSVFKGSEAVIVLSDTPFYAESGGQVGDSGIISAPGMEFTVKNCQKTAAGHYYHIGTVTEGMLEQGADVVAKVDKKRRANITRNHTGAHLLQAALREVLGDHVHQAGSHVDEFRLRFDFSHFEALTAKEIFKIENLINNYILSNKAVAVEVMPIEEAKNKGALALFGEKYGDEVRVVEVGDISTEFCGGCHVKNSSEIGLFKITAESSIAAGVRRIEATTGFGVLRIIAEGEILLKLIADNLKLSSLHEIPEKIQALQVDVKEKDRQIMALNKKFAETMVSSVGENTEKIGEFLLASQSYKNENMETLRSLADKFKEQNEDGIIVLINREKEGKGTILISAGKKAVANGIHAGNLVKELAKLAGGSGGGRPDNAMAGIKDTALADEIIKKASLIIANLK